MGTLGFVHKRIQDAKSRLMTLVWYRWMFAGTGEKCSISPPFYPVQPERIRLGKRVYIGPGCRLEAVPAEGADKRKTVLDIGDRVRVGHRVTISAVNRVVIGAETNIASGCYIGDNNYAIDPEGPAYLDQPVTGAETRIGRSVWIGQNVCVLAGATIGDRSVIGAGSVVRGNIPPYSMAVGVPARVVKRYDFDKKAWVRVERGDGAKGAETVRGDGEMRLEQDRENGGRREEEDRDNSVHQAEEDRVGGVQRVDGERTHGGRGTETGREDAGEQGATGEAKAERLA